MLSNLSCIVQHPMYKNTFLFLIIVGILILGLFIAKNRLIYHPSPESKEKFFRLNSKLIGLAGSKNLVKNFRIKTCDNIYLDTFYLINQNTSKSIIIFHGNGGNISMRYEIIKFLYNYASVIIFDYRSYGRSSGNFFDISSYGFDLDAKAVWNFCLVSLKIQPTDISFFGESIGCSVAIHLLEEISRTYDSTYYPHSVILNSPFLSMKSMIKETLLKMHAGFMANVLAQILGTDYKSDKWIEYVNHSTKIIIAHSQNDEMIPFDHGYRLFQSLLKFHPNVKFITISGSHNSPSFTDPYIYSLAELFDD